MRVDGITNATRVVGGVGFACALLETHTIKCWGFGELGELGNGRFESSLTPVEVSGITNAIAIAAGEVGACAVLADHTVWCWGDGRNGALGDGSTESSASPVQVSGITNAVAVTAADLDACAVLETGEARCWGRNGRDDLGDGRTHNEQEYTTVPVAVSGVSEASAIAANLEHVCALLKGGGVDCWGDGEFGDLGNGTSFEESPTAVPVSGITTATQLAAGYWHNCVVLSSGGVECWGDNTFGELGTGSTAEESSTPVAVSGISGAAGIAAYEFTTIAYGPSFPVGELVPTPTPEELYGGENPSQPEYSNPCAGDPVSCGTGNLVESQTDLTIGGRGIPLMLTRTYNSQAAAGEATPGPFGYGWSSSFSDHLVISPSEGAVTVVQANGSTVRFTGYTGQPGELTHAKWAEAKLVLNSDGSYTYTLPTQVVFQFDSTGRLISESDRNGNAATLNRNGEGRLESVTNSSGRKLTFAYNSEGLVESVADPMSHVVKYSYESGKLASVTLPGGTSPRWQFRYDGSNQLTEITDGRGGRTVNEYNGTNQVVAQTDPATRTTTFEYKPFQTQITNKATGAVTRELFTAGHELESITHGYGTASATTESFAYNPAGEVITKIDANHHLTKNAYDAAGNRTSTVDADGHETKWEYNATHDVIATTTPKGEKTTIKRDSHGNAIEVSRPAPNGQTQTTHYKYDSHGDLESAEDPLKRAWKYEYNTTGDRTAETDPTGDRRQWEYDADSYEIATISPRGSKEPLKYTTKFERDAQERVTKTTAPLVHETTSEYDANGNLKAVTDPNGHTTKYEYNADNEPTKVTEPDGAITETGYDGAGRVTSRTDGSKHVTRYERNVLGEIVEVVDPRGRRTSKHYDAAGNLTKVTDAASRTATYEYDPANRLTETTYSDGKTAPVKYEYDADGNRIKMTDGTGASEYEYDQLDRLVKSVDGHGDTMNYRYDLADQETEITYPSNKAIKREYDKAGRLEAVTDWAANRTKFTYDADSDLTSTVFPSGTGNTDKYTYDVADVATKTEMKHGTEVLASLVYARDKNGQLKQTTQKGLPGEEKTAYTYDGSNRLTKSGTTGYEYDPANNLKKIGTLENSYSESDELEKSGATTFAYDEVGERTQRTPSGGATTTYGYDQAGDLTSVARPSGAEPAIEDAYSYNGDGLRTAQTVSGATSYLSWDVNSSLPLLLDDGANSYIYGPGGLPVEQLSDDGTTILYLHHDQQGSTRMLTGTTGAKEATFTYDPYGNQIGRTGTATTPLGYDAQYTNSDTGLIYMRARTYDPATAQFMRVDPLNSQTGAPYSYAQDNPLNSSDPAGLCGLGSVGEALESVNPLSEENCAYQGTKALVEALGGDASTMGIVASAIAFGVAPFSPPLAVALGLISGAASSYAAGQEAASGEYLKAAVDSLGALLGGSAAAEHVLGAIESLLPKLAGETASASTKALAELLDRLGYGPLAASILNLLTAHEQPVTAREQPVGEPQPC